MKHAVQPYNLGEFNAVFGKMCVLRGLMTSPGVLLSGAYKIQVSARERERQN